MGLSLLSGQPSGYHFNTLMVEDYGAWNFNYDPPLQTRWLERVGPWGNEYYSVGSTEQMLCDSAGVPQIILTSSKGFRNAKYEYLYTLADKEGVPKNMGVRSIMPGEGNTFIGLGSIYTSFYGYRINPTGKVDSIWLTGFRKDSAALWQHSIRQVREDTTWMVKVEYRDRGIALQDTFLWSYATKQGDVKVHKEVAFSAENKLRRPAWATNSGTIISHVTSTGLVFCRIGYSDGDPFTGLYKSYNVKIQFNRGFSEVLDFEVMDSAYSDVNHVGSTVYRSVVSPNGRFVYYLIEKAENLWFNDKGERELTEFAEVWQHNLNTRENLRLDLENNRDTIWKITDMVLAPNGQVYVTGEIDSFSTDWKRRSASFLAQIPFPDKKGDSSGFQLLKMEKARGTLEERQGYNYSFSETVEVPRIDYLIETSCDDGTVTINNQSPDVFKSFTWYFLRQSDSVILDSVDGMSPEVALSESGSYYVRAVGETASGYKNWRWDYFDYVKRPVARFDTLSQLGCQWAKITFEDESLSDTTKDPIGNSWHWSFFKNGNKVIDSRDDNPEIRFSEIGAYSVELVYSNGFCSDTLYKQNLVTVREAPKPGFTVSDTFICAPASIRFEDNSDKTYEHIQYTWSDGLKHEAADGKRDFDSIGTYTLLQQLSGSNACISRDSVAVRITGGVNMPRYRPKAYHASVLDNDSVVLAVQSESWTDHYLLRKRSKSLELTDTIYAPFSKVVDRSHSPHKGEINYILSAVDSCAEESSSSSTVQTLFLQGTNLNNELMELHWNAGKVFPGRIKEYHLEQLVEGSLWKVVHSVKDTIYNLPFQANEKEEYTWRLMAIISEDTVYSNHIRTTAESVIFIPNAFSPNGDGLNEVFRIGAHGISSFEAIVYSSTGQILAYSTDYMNVWNGADILGSRQPVGDYGYWFSIETSTGEQLERTGIVTIVR